MSIFVARGFLSGQPAVTDNSPYLDVGLASQVKNTLADAANEDEALEAICDARFLSAGGLESDLPEHISMSQGDQVLFADDAPELEGVHHQQTVEVVVGANVAYDVREKLAGLIRPDRAIETMWF